MTIGVAVSVPEPLASEVSEVRTALSGPEVSTIPTHVTLLPPTLVPRAAMTDIVEHLRAVGATRVPFTLRLQGTDTFRPVTDVVFLRVVEGAAHCADLQEGIRSGPLSVELRFPYHPHVTLAHDVDDEALDTAEAQMGGVDRAFPVDEFVLYLGSSAQTWSPVERIALSGRGSAASTSHEQ